MSVQVWRAGAAGCLLLASACAETPQPAPLPVAEPILPGVFRGTSTRFRADSRACPPPGLVTIRPDNGYFTYRWNARTQVPVTIASDGTLSGLLNDIQISGKATAQRIEGIVESPGCGLHFTTMRRG